MDAPTYSLNQKWSVKKSIFGNNFHSLFYVSHFGTFCPFSSSFFFLLRCLNMELLPETEMTDWVWTIN